MRYINPQHKETYEQVREALRKHNPEQLELLDRTIYLGIGGSKLYGTDTPDSDTDLRGVTIAPKDYWVGAKHFEQIELKDLPNKTELVIYDVRKWLRLTADVNPNVIEILYSNDQDLMIGGDPGVWEYIKAQTLPLINQRAYVGFHGYSSSQLKKMVTKQSNKTGRQEFTEKYGFDTKFLSHGFRIARQGVELLETGQITFPRPDRAELLDIKLGKKYKLEDQDQAIEDWKQEAQKLDEAYTTTKLPVKYDFRRFNELHINIYERFVN